MNEYWSWILSILGLIGFFLAGRKVWWCWYVNIANQAIWLAYSIVTEQWGFLLATFAYLFVFSKNAYEWTRDRNKPEEKATGKILAVDVYEGGVSVAGYVNEGETLESLDEDDLDWNTRTSLAEEHWLRDILESNKKALDYEIYKAPPIKRSKPEE